MSIGLRVEGAPLDYATTLREEVTELQGDTPIYFVRTLRDAVNSNLINLIIIGGLFVTFGVAAFFMASVGLFAVTSFLANQRIREVGLRMALGARAGNILGLIFRQGLVQVLTGLALGLLLAAAMIRLITGSVAIAVAAWNLPLTLAVCGELGLTGITAVVRPALRTMRVRIRLARWCSCPQSNSRWSPVGRILISSRGSSNSPERKVGSRLRKVKPQSIAPFFALTRLPVPWGGARCCRSHAPI